MRIGLKLMTEIINTVQLAANSGASKAYVNERLIRVFAAFNRKETYQYPQISSGWITRVQIGHMTFIHESQEKLSL